MFEGHHIDRLTDAITGAAQSLSGAAQSITALANAKANEHSLSHDDREVLDHLTTKLKSLARRARVVTEGFKTLDAATDSK
jgi:hypothetical protein